MTHRMPVALAAFALVAGALAAPVPAQPASSAAQRARVDSIFARFDRRDGPGCAVAAIRAGAVDHARGYGMADLEHDVPITPATTFYVASVSKQFAAYGVILLARDGRLSLDDDVRKFFPELHDFAPRYGRPITVRHLLNHTSGLRDYFALLSLDGWPDDGPVTEREFLRLMGRQRTLNFTPGTQHLYSNSGYVLLAMLVERVSGQRLRDFAAARIFAPLGMTGTVVRDDHAMPVRRRASAYVGRPGAWRVSVPGFDVVGDGGVYSTVEDLARWDGNFYEPRSGDRAALAMLHQRGVLVSGDTIAYAAGLTLGRHRGLRTVAHGGAYGGYRAMLLRFPDQRFTAAVLCNDGSANSTQLAQRVAEVYLAAEMTPVETRAAAAAAPVPTIALPDAELARYAGLYWNEENEERLAVVHAPGRLTLSGSGAPAALRHLRAATFEAPAAGVRLAFGEGTLLVTGRDGRSTTYRVVATTPPNAAALAALAGRYASDEADAQVEIRVRDGRLELGGRRIGPIPLEHVFGDTFVGGPGVIRFVRERDAVRGLTISNGRSRGVPFARAGP